jgi:hypothetical protein
MTLEQFSYFSSYLHFSFLRCDLISSNEVPQFLYSFESLILTIFKICNDVLLESVELKPK